MEIYNKSTPWQKRPFHNYKYRGIMGRIGKVINSLKLKFKTWDSISEKY